MTNEELEELKKQRDICAYWLQRHSSSNSGYLIWSAYQADWQTATDKIVEETKKLNLAPLPDTEQKELAVGMLPQLDELINQIYALQRKIEVEYFHEELPTDQEPQYTYGQFRLLHTELETAMLALSRSYARLDALKRKPKPNHEKKSRNSKG